MSSQLEDQLRELVFLPICTKDISLKFFERINKGSLTQEENQESHFLCYFAAYDPKIGEVFIGHHKKSGLWLFNGGHIDKGETLEQTLEREIDEEWGLDMAAFEVGMPSLLTMTPINNLPKQLCRDHYDIWYFIKVNKTDFNPNDKNLSEEFYQTKWVSLQEARKLITEANTLRAIDQIEGF